MDTLHALEKSLSKIKSSYVLTLIQYKYKKIGRKKLCQIIIGLLKFQT